MEKIESKGDKLKQHLRNKEWFEVLLLDLFRSGEMSQEEYTKMLKDRQSAYMKFLEDLKKQ